MFLVPKMIGIGEPPLRIEILKKLDTVDFNYAYERSELKKVDGLDIRVVGLDDLILFRSWGSNHNLTVINDESKTKP